MSTTPSIASVVNDLRNQNQNLPTEKKQNIIVVQDNASASEADKTGQMLTVLNNIFNAVSEQLRLTRESLNLQKEDRLAAKDFQKEAMDVSSGKYEPPQAAGGGGEGGGGGASPAGGGGGIIEQAGKVGGGLWESAKGLGKAAVGVAARHPIATAVGAGAAIGLGADYILGKDKAGGTLGNLISRGESRSSDPYKVYRGSQGKDITKMTLAEIIAEQNAGRIHAAGKYQIVGPQQKGKPGILEESVRALGIDPKSTYYTPEIQEKIFRGYLIAGKRPSIKSYITGKTDNLEQAEIEMAKEMASVGVPKNMMGHKRFVSKGQSFYAGVSGNKASIRPEELEKTFLEERKKYQEFIKSGMSPEDAWYALSNLNRKGGFREPSKKSSPETGTATKIAQPNNGNIGTPIALNQLQSGDLKNLQLPDNVSTSKLFQQRGGFKGIDPVLVEGILGAAKNWKGKVEIFSGNRGKGDKGNHSSGNALDVKLIDENGREIIPIKGGKANYYGDIKSKGPGYYDPKQYETFMRDAVAWGSQFDKNFEKDNRWGGDFGIEDYMHLDRMRGKRDSRGRVHGLGRKGSLEGGLAGVSGGMGMSWEEWREARFGTPSTNTQLAKSGRHQLERTDEKSSVLQASMFAPLEKAIDKMSNILTSIDKNTGKTEENTKEIKTASKEEQTKTEEPTATKTETEETETPTATKAEEEQDQSQDLASMMGGSDEGSNLMKILFGQGGFMGSAEPIEPGSAKRKYIDSLPSYPDKLGEMVKNLILGEGDVDVEQAMGALGGTATPQETSDQLGSLGVTPTMPQNFTEQLLGEVGAPQKQKRSQEGKLSPELRKEMEEKYKDLSPADRELAIQEFENALNKSTEPGVDRVTSESPGLFKFDVSKPEADLSKLKSNQLSNLGVNPFGGQQGGMLNNIFSGGMPNAGNNPFYSMQGMLGKIGSIANMGMNVGGMMQQGGLGGARSVMGQVGGILQGMGSGFPMTQGIGGMMRNVGGIMGSVQGIQNIGQGGMGGVMGGIGAASGVLGSLGSIFGNVQGMSGGIGKMMGGLGVTPFGGESMMGGNGLAGGLSNIGNSVGNLFGGIGDSIGGLFGGNDSNRGKGISSLSIGDDSASLKQTYSESSEPVGGNLESLQSSNEELSASPTSLSTGRGNTQSPGAGGGMPADRGSISSSQGASSAPKSGAGARTGTSSGAMGIGMEGYNDCPTLYKWQFRTSYWGKV